MLHIGMVSSPRSLQMVCVTLLMHVCASTAHMPLGLVQPGPCPLITGEHVGCSAHAAAFVRPPAHYAECRLDMLRDGDCTQVL